jgi:hypothetical protein
MRRKLCASDQNRDGIGMHQLHKLNAMADEAVVLLRLAHLRKQKLMNAAG